MSERYYYCPNLTINIPKRLRKYHDPAARYYKVFTTCYYHATPREGRISTQGLAIKWTIIFARVVNFFLL